MNKVSLKEFDKAINELPKTNDIVSAFSSVSVKELRKAVERFEYVPSFNDLLEENNRLSNLINELEKTFVNDDKRIKEYNIEHPERPLDNYSKYYLDKLKELKEGK